MSGNEKAGKKARETMLAKDPNYFKNLASIGGKWKGQKGIAKLSKRQRRAIAMLGVEARRIKAEQKAKSEESDE